jgi:hypothetical protein
VLYNRQADRYHVTLQHEMEIEPRPHPFSSINAGYWRTGLLSIQVDRPLQEAVDELFHQQVSMAVCSTIEKCSGKVDCGPASKPMMCDTLHAPGGQTGLNHFLVNIEPQPTRAAENSSTPNVADNDEFQSQLKRTLDFYNA